MSGLRHFKIMQAEVLQGAKAFERLDRALFQIEKKPKVLDLL